MQRTLGNPAVQRMLQPHVEGLKAGLIGTTSPCFGHDFSRIPLYPPIGRVIQTKLAINTPGDEYEQEADRVAEQVMRLPEPQLQRACACGGECPKCQTQQPDQGHLRLQTNGVQASDTGQRAASPIVHEVLAAPGQPLDAATRDFMEPRFGHNFAHVRVHTDAKAAKSARAVNALAYTAGRNIVFGAGQYAPGTSTGQRLMAHELTHVIRQDGQRGPARLQRECDDPNFCTPYATTAEATAEEAWLRSYFLPTMSAKFGTEVHDLWESFLSRAPGASLSRRVFETPGNPIEESFATSSATDADQDAVLDMVINRVTSFPGGRLSPHSHTVSSLTNYLSASEMDNRPINYSNPFSKAGNIAGGIGSSDAGPDSRKIASANVSMEKVPLIGDSGYIDFKLIPHYEVHDAVDLCPGQCGSPAEQKFTIPLSRLEESGEAYDVPYVVRFQPEPRTNREFYSSFPI